MSIKTVKAPGRICLFGDHQDYLELPIIACAINRYISITSRHTGKDYFLIKMPDIGQEKIVCLSINPEENSIGDHLVAALKVLASYNCLPTSGYELIVRGDIPINAGLSSSSALIVAWVQWLLATFGCNQKVTPLLVALIAYQAEVVEQNASGGKMDQYTSALGGIIYLETNFASYIEPIEIPLEGLIIGVSGIPKDTLGLLGDRRSNALKAIAKIKKISPDFQLAQASLKDYETFKNELSADEIPYFYAAIKNHLITKEALVCFRELDLDSSQKILDYKKIGALMTAHHKVLKDSLKITVPRIDTMMDAAIAAGAYGAKIVGSGGGGSIFALSPKGKEEKIINALKIAGAKEAYQVNVSKGVHLI